MYVELFTLFRLTGRNLSISNCKLLGSVLSSESSALQELDLSDNNLGQPKMQLLSAGVESPCCTLKTLRSGFLNCSFQFDGFFPMSYP